MKRILNTAIRSVAIALLTTNVTAGTARAEQGNMPAGRLGLVVFQFDDGTIGHYTHAYRILEKYGLKGSFGVVTGILDKPGRLTRAQLVEMDKAGHEIHDHTLYHRAAFWGNADNEGQWTERIEQSLAILKKAGINTRGWNQPGGKGQGWSEPLRLTLAKHYDYAAGRVALRGEQLRNFHWHLRDDPLSLGRGGVCSWGYNGGKGDPIKEVAGIKTRMADAIQRGVVVIPLWHVVADKDRTAWSLEEICKFVRHNRLPTMVMADAVRAVRNPRRHFAATVEQMPNPAFDRDLDENDRPDGYSECCYAPLNVTSPTGGRAVECTGRTATRIYGPEPGRARFRLTVRSADDTPRTVAPAVTRVEVSDKYEYRVCPKESCKPMPIGPDWTEHTFSVEIGKRVDSVTITFTVTPPGPFYLGAASWRRGPPR